MSSTENENTPKNDGIEVDELRSMFRGEVKAELDERGITKEVADKLGILDSLEGLFEKHKGGSVDQDSLLGKIGEMIDNKLKGIPSGGSNGSKERQPKIRVF